MPKFTIEMTYDVPHYRQHTYEAATLEEALKLAREDSDWGDEKEDVEAHGPDRVTGAWAGEQAYVGDDLTMTSPDEFAGLQVRHDMLGYYVCTDEEAEHEDEGNASVGFDGRAHFGSIESAQASLTTQSQESA